MDLCNKMTGKIVKLYLLFQFTYSFSYAGCACKVGAFVYHNGLSVEHHFSYGSSGEYLYVHPGDSITLYGYADGGTCPFNLLKIFFNNNLIYDGIGRSLTVHEIGAYHLELMC